MYQFNGRKNRRRVSAVIIILLVLAMVIPTLSYFAF